MLQCSAIFVYIRACGKLIANHVIRVNERSGDGLHLVAEHGDFVYAAGSTTPLTRRVHSGCIRREE